MLATNISTLSVNIHCAVRIPFLIYDGRAADPSDRATLEAQGPVPRHPGNTGRAGGPGRPDRMSHFLAPGPARILKKRSES
jgi:hypothetical protein